MTWIRNPWWDCFWILSGAPIGLALMVLVPGMVPALGITMMILESAHVVSPILLAWTKPGLRSIVIREWIKHVVLPSGIMVAVVIVPASWVMGLYFVWNIHHFGMQNFGVTSLYFRGGTYDSRILRGILCLGVTAFGMGILPYLTSNWLVMAFCIGMFSFNHWLADIGISSRVARWHCGFIAIVIIMGVAWLVLRNGLLSVRIVPQIVVIRLGFGMIHFIYSARIWRLSDPKVKAAIGQDIFRSRPIQIRYVAENVS